MLIKKLPPLIEFKNKGVLVTHLFDPAIIEYWAAVHLIFYSKDESSPLFLAVIKRAKNVNDPWSSHYAFPGGGVNEQESYKSASIRETSEEIGLNISTGSYLGEFYRIQVLRNNVPSKLAISAHASLITKIDLPTLSPCPLEVEQCFWFPLEGLLSEASIIWKDFDISNKSRHLPCIDYQGHIIWGLSYIILREFLVQWTQYFDEEICRELTLKLPGYGYNEMKFKPVGE